jgi:hypothetical protein
VKLAYRYISQRQSCIQKEELALDNSEIYKAILRLDRNQIVKFLSGDISASMKALGLARLGSFAEAEAVLSSIDRQSISSIEKQLYQETQLLLTHQKSDYELLLTDSKKMLLEFPDSFFGNYMCAQTNKWKRNWQESYACFCRCLKIFPDEEFLNYEAFALADKLKKKKPDYRLKITSKKYLTRVALGTNLPLRIVLWLCFLGILLATNQLGMSLDSIIVSIVLLAWVIAFKRREVLILKFIDGLMVISVGYYLIAFLFSVLQLS